MHPDGVKLLTHLGYPDYFNYILGVGRLLGIVGIWQTKVPFLREWAYAAFVIDFVAAIASHLFVGDPFSAAFPAFMNLVIVLASYVTMRKVSKK